MIQANELRIGNTCIGASRGGYVTVTGRMLAQFEEGKLNLLPIPLTPEVLEGCGFARDEKAGPSWYYLAYTALEEGDEDVDEVDDKFLRHEVWLNLNTESFRACVSNHTYGKEGATPKEKVKYLHQLQNLWYFLAGTELPVSLPVNH